MTRILLDATGTWAAPSDRAHLVTYRLIGERGPSSSRRPTCAGRKNEKHLWKAILTQKKGEDKWTKKKVTPGVERGTAGGEAD